MNPSQPLQPQTQGTIEQTQHHSDDIIELKKIFFLFLHNWYFFLITLLLTIAGAYLYNRFAVPTYRVSTTLLIEDNQNRPDYNLNNIMEGFGLREGMQNIENQIQILTSYSMVEKAIGTLPFGVEYYYREKIYKISLYPDTPIRVIPDGSENLPYGLEFTVLFLGEDKLYVSIEDNEYFKFNKEVILGEELLGEGYMFCIEPNLEFWPQANLTRPLYFMFHKKQNLIGKYKNRLKVELLSREATIAEISLEGKNWRMDLDFLLKLNEVFLASNVEKKNQKASRTIQFINEQLAGVFDSLLLTEDRLQRFRSQNRIIDISEQANRLLDQAMIRENEKANLILERNYYNYLKEYLSTDRRINELIAPATMGISDPIVARLVEQMAELQAEYYSYGMGDKNPVQAGLALRIQNTKETLLETLKSIIRNNEMAMNENQARLKELNRQAAYLPVTERKLLGIEREFKLNDALYTFLLEKQAEAKIQEASNMPDNEVIDQPWVHNNPIRPNKKMIYMIALLTGLGLPGLFLFILDATNIRINSNDDIKRITILPISGHIPHYKEKYQTVVLKDTHSQIAEAFRSLRTRMQYFTKETISPVILVTSSMPREGKTFIAINLASAYSLSGKKTVLVGFDMRRPKIYDDFDLSNEKGISSYLIGQDLLEDILQPSGYPNLDVITAGPIPPNPAELTSSEKLGELITGLKKQYDYIVLDSSPIGTISDTYALAAKSDSCIILVRHNNTLKRLLETTLADIKANGIIGLSLLVNDLKSGKNYYRYAYNYKYGYKNEKKSN